MPPNPPKIFNLRRLTPSSIDEMAMKDVANRNPKTAHGMPTGKPPEKVNSEIIITLVEIIETQIATQNEYLLVIPKE